jgi:hypothetical protein
MMKKNVGGADRIVRFVAGIAIMGAGVYFQSWWGLLGVAVFGTAIFKTCFLYNLIGMSTCPVEDKAPAEGKTQTPTSTTPPTAG